jgi:branched-chain amino acid transport system substrate-binding protein
MKKKSKITWLFISMFLVFMVYGLLPSKPTYAAPKRIKIGSAMPLTGPLGFLGTAYNRGWQLYIDKINEEGGVKVGGETYLFELVTEDSKLAAEAAGTAARKLIGQDKVDYLIGGIVESEMEAMYQVSRPKKVPLMLASMNIPGHPADVSPKRPLLVRMTISFDDTDSIDCDYIVKAYPKAKNVVLLAGSIGQEGMVERLTKQAKKSGLNIVGVEYWQDGTTDFVPTCTRVLKYKPDVVYAMGTGQSPYILMAARQLGFKGLFVCNVPLGPEVFLRVVNDPAALTDVITNGIDLSQPTDTMKEIMKRWEAKYKEPFMSDSVVAWDELWILTQAMEKAQSIVGEKVFATLETMNKPGSLKTSFGPGRMGGKERFGVDRTVARPIPLTRIMNGKTEFIGFIKK